VNLNLETHNKYPYEQYVKRDLKKRRERQKSSLTHADELLFGSGRKREEKTRRERNL